MHVRLTLLMISFLVMLSATAQDCYIVPARKQAAGFFSAFNTVIGALDYVDRLHADIVVDFGQEGLYYDQQMGSNWWSYYFEPFQHSRLGPKIYKRFKEYQLNTIFTLSAQFVLSRERGYELIKKYIRLKPVIARKTEKFVKKHFNGFYVIGIHYRGTDKNIEAMTVSYETVHNQVLQAIKQMPSKFPVKIFIATDDAHFLAYMKKHFKKKICALKAIRSSDNIPVHMRNDISAYKKGEDALLDCILLSRTNFLIKMASNLSDVSLRFNPRLPYIELNTCFSE